MARKKLTKIQIRKKLKMAFRALFELEMDKLGQMDSLVPISVPKLLEMSDAIKRAEKRIK
tara:strand:+ start:499 stop:678 length:180 start_codon:yes stop_codon:yes gene_type:complete